MKTRSAGSVVRAMVGTTIGLGHVFLMVLALGWIGFLPVPSVSAASASFSEFAPAMPALYNNSAAWGDFDNDGDLDLALSGTETNTHNGLSRIYRNNGGGSFTDINAGLDPLNVSWVAWGDYDRDGDLDLALCGLVTGSLARSHIYRNDGNSTFTDINAGLAGCYGGVLAWGDFDNDGDLDLLMNGALSGARIYRNNNGIFTDAQAGLSGLEFGTGLWGDYDNDGRLDVLLAGFGPGIGYQTALYHNNGGNSFTVASTNFIGNSGSQGASLGDYDNDGDLDLSFAGGAGFPTASRLYRNNGGGNFTALPLPLPALIAGSTVWGDYDNDGRLDLLLAGGNTNGAGTLAKLYHNDGNDSFSDTSLTLPGIQAGAAIWGDYNNDGRLDFFLSGYNGGPFRLIRLFQNTELTINSSPSPPTALFASSASNSVTLSWTEGADANQSAGLSYNVRVGRTSGGQEILTPMAHLGTGRRRVPGPGNAEHRRSLMLTNLATGHYYWSVQSIDNGFAASPFASERSFFVNLSPGISDITNQTVTMNSTSAPIPFLVGDAVTPADHLIVTGSSSNPDLVPHTNIVFSGTSTNRTVVITPATNRAGVVTITITVSNTNGASSSDTFELTVFNPPPVISDIPNQTIGLDASTPTVSFTVSDPEASGEQLQVTAVSSNPTAIPASAILLGGSGNNRTIRVTVPRGAPASMVIIVTVTDPQGGSASDTFFLTVPPFVERSPTMAGLLPSKVAWGDFDGDGDLDLLAMGSVDETPTTRLYRNDGGSGFTDLEAALPQRSNGAVAWGDCDNDGDLDLALAGDHLGVFSTEILRNDGNAVFTKLDVALPPVSGDVSWADYDSDGDLDLLLIGPERVTVGPDLPLTRLYRNDGNGAFAASGVVLPGIRDGGAAWGDYDTDGDVDLLLWGITNTLGGSAITRLYRNEAGGAFTLATNTLPRFRNGSAAWGDFDNDSDLDLLLTGVTNSTAFAGIYRNDSGGTFTVSPPTLPAVNFGTAAWGDFDLDGDFDALVLGLNGSSDYLARVIRNGIPPVFAVNLPGITGSGAWGDYDGDGDLDIVLSGGAPGNPASTKIFQNLALPTNTPPAAPSGLNATLSADSSSLQLTWGAATDGQQLGGFTYNLRIGSVTGAANISSPMSRSDGRRLLPQLGNAGPSRSWSLKNLHQGTYFWSVQAIDSSFQGSAFAPEHSFIITNSLPTISDTIGHTANVNIPVAPIQFVIGDRDTPPDSSLLNATSSNTNLVPNEGLSLSGSGNNRSLSILPRRDQLGETIITLTVTDGDGASVSDAFLLLVINESPNLIGVPQDVMRVVGSPPAELEFTASDLESPVTNLLVAATFSNTSLVPPENVSLTRSNQLFRLRFAPTPGQTGTSLITISVTDEHGFSASQTPLLSVVSNTPPNIVNLPDQTIGGNTSTAPFYFSVSDGQTLATNLVVTGRSLNTNLVPDANIVFSGSGEVRGIQVTPQTNQFGTTIITVTVSDEHGGTNMDSFVLTVTNASPTIIAPPSQTAPPNSPPVVIPFLVFDRESPSSALTVTIRSGDTNFLPNANISLGGSDSNRTLTVAVPAGSVGQATIFITAFDANGGTNTVPLTFIVLTYTEVAVGLEPATRSAAAWGDLDNDNDLDLVVSGLGADSTARTRVYRNDGSTFTVVESNLDNLSDGSLALADFDNDGSLDVAISGLSPTAEVTRLYRNLGGFQFTQMPIVLPGSSRGTLDWADFDNDGDVDLLIGGIVLGTRIFRNQGGTNFTDVFAGLPANNGRSAAWGDYDNDADFDLLLPGSTTLILRNNGSGAFAIATGLPGQSGGTAAWGDFDNDGDLDVATPGASGLGAGGLSRVFRNDGPGTFVDLGASLVGQSSSTAVWADHNNDGRLDLLLSGSRFVGSSNELLTVLCQNDGGGNFIPLTELFVGVLSGSHAWGDFDNDQDLDLLVTGSLGDQFGAAGAPASRLYKNHTTKPNTPPRPPEDPFASVSRNSASLNWARASDANQSGGLTYNLRVGTTPDGSEIVSPASDPITGYRRLAKAGNVGTTTSKTLTNLAFGIYYWSVQAIDHSFAGSAWAPGGMFTIANTPPTISPLSNRSTPRNRPTSSFEFTLGDFETPVTQLVLTVQSGDTNLVSDAGLILTGSGGARALQLIPTGAATGTVTITLTVTDGHGASTISSFDLHVLQAAPIISGLSNYSAAVNQTLTIPFMVTDLDNASDELTLSATSFQTNVVPAGNLFLSGNGTNRTLSVIPATNRAGQAFIDITVADPAGAGLTVSFSINFTNSLPRILGLTNQIAYPGVPLLVPFQVVDAETVSEQITLTANSLPAILASTNFAIGGTGSNRVLTITASRFLPATNITIRIIAVDPAGGSSLASFPLSIEPFTAVPLSMTPIRESAVAFGDYDNDGDLDLVVAGRSNGQPATRLYRNDLSNGLPTMTVVQSSLPNIAGGAVTWGDCDNDGDLDLLLSGSDISRIYRNDGSNVFTDLQASLANLSASAATWGDFTGDGRLDLLLTGSEPQSNGVTAYVTKLYRNDGNGSFTDLRLPLPGVTNGAVACADFNKDGHLDAIITGWSSSGPTTRLLRNTGTNSFAEIFHPFSPIWKSSVSWGDFDNDGDLDLAAQGALTSSAFPALYTQIAQNTASNVFNLFSGVSPPLFEGTVAWGDYNNDGFLDLLQTGHTGGGNFATARVFRNNGTGFFTDAQANLSRAFLGASAWADLDNDGDLDVLITGATNSGSSSASATWLRNNTGIANTSPAQPGNLAALALPKREIQLTWSASSDLQTTNANGLSYNLRIGTTPGGTDILSPHSDPVTGIRRVPTLGNAGQSRSKLLRGLPAGTYFWSVQAIDGTFAGSQFAPDASFIVATNNPPVATNQSLTLAEDTTRSFQLAAADPDGDPLNFAVLLPPTNGTIVPGPNGFPSAVYRPFTNYFGPDSFTFAAGDGLADSAPAVVTITVTPVQDVAAANLAAVRLPDDRLQVTLSGEPRAVHAIEVSTNLVNWTELMSVEANSSGLISFIDPSVGLSQRFYRARKDP